MTLEEAKSLKQGSWIHHVSLMNADGTPVRYKVLSVKTWKRWLERVELSTRYGLKVFIRWNEAELGELGVGGRKILNAHGLLRTLLATPQAEQERSFEGANTNCL